MDNISGKVFHNEPVHCELPYISFVRKNSFSQSAAIDFGIVIA